MTTFLRHFCSGLIAASVSLLGASAYCAESASTGTYSAVKPKAAAVPKRSSARKPASPPRVSAKLGSQAAHAAPQRAAPKTVVAAKPSMGEMEGLRATPDKLALKSSVALVMDQDTDEVLFSKNSQAVLPIASITKLMTAVVVTDAGLPLDEVLTVTQDDVDTEKGSRSRLSVGTQLTREEMLHLALMSSENRAAHALGRNYPGGLAVFVNAMNAKARSLGMTDTHYVEPTGLSSLNQSSAHDLATLVKLAHTHPLIRELSTSPQFLVDVGSRKLQFRNTNRLVSNPTWDIGLQKTGYITEAGRCLVMQASLAGRKLIMVFLDSSGLNTRLADAERVRRWVTQMTPKPVS
ncbi:MAG: D-alanyl-D-alanine endopeptidase [Burkholderiales bacterium 28-67-8]|nr:MAG: D-alanyl-D-alanine endopeptidase [Burkholderiales bacterium 28-67-8]